MLSIIVSSYQKKYFKQFSQNVKETIGEGFVYEIIQIWNPGLMGICKAYNKGAEQAKYENLLFVHEDVLFETNNWGKNLLKHLIDLKTGIVGIAGGGYKSNFPSSWSTNGETKRMNIIQNFKSGEKEIFYLNPYNEVKSQVTVLDGVFLAVKKKVWKKYKFDSKLLNGFHGYDIDFSLAVAQDYKNFVVHDILIEHFSEGNPDVKWLEAASIISKKWKKKLPKYVGTLSHKEQRSIYYDSFLQFNHKMKSLGFRKNIRFINIVKFWGRIPSLKTLFYIWKKI